MVSAPSASWNASDMARDRRRVLSSVRQASRAGVWVGWALRMRVAWSKRWTRSELRAA